METITTNIELLYEKAKKYVDVNIQLVKLHGVDKIADLISSVLSWAIISMIVAMFILLASISLSLYLGELFGETYLGYLAVSGFYLLLFILLILTRSSIIKIPITNLVIAKLLKRKSVVNP